MKNRLFNALILVCVLLMLSAVCGCLSQSQNTSDISQVTPQNTQDTLQNSSDAQSQNIKRIDINSVTFFADTEAYKMNASKTRREIFKDVFLTSLISPSTITELGLQPLIKCGLSEMIVTPNTTTPMHLMKDTSETVYVVDGKADLIVNGKEYSVIAGDAIFVPKNTPLSVKNNLDTELKYISITSPAFNKSAQLLPDSEGYNESKAKAKDPIYLKLSEIPDKGTFNDITITCFIKSSQLYDEDQIGDDSNSGYGMGQITIPVGKQIDQHSLDGITEINYVLSGNGKIIINKQEVEFSKGDLIYFPAGVKQSIINTGTTDLSLISVTDPPHNFSMEPLEN